MQKKRTQKILDSRFQLLDSTRAQMLVEAMVAMGILTVAVFAIFSLLTRSTSLNRVISQQYVATYLASEGLELVKNITDSNQLSCTRPWPMGAVGGELGHPNVYEVDYASEEMRPTSGQKLYVDSNGFYGYAQTGTISPFTRTVTIETIKDNTEIRVISIVKWRGRGGVESEIRLEDHFFNWRPRPAGC